MHRGESFSVQESQRSQLKTSLSRVHSTIEEQIPIEEIFTTKGRINILKILVAKKELNISKIAAQAHLNHASTRKHLNIFVKAGIVEKKQFGRIQIYRLCIENMKVRAIQRLFELWENSNL